MECPRCGYDNRQGRKFCSKCAAPLQRVCPACEAINESDDLFCGECAAPLTLEAVSPKAATPAPTTPTPTPAPSPVSAVPSSFSGGRYQTIKFLGEGGKKKVYLAKDTLLDREVAFALIKSQGLDDTARLRIKREAQAMGRLGSHPHIVTVFDLGEENGQPYMVTEFMNGGDVEHLLDKAPGHRLSMERGIQLAAEVCRGLEYAHSRGIVHRDLKPGNVWLTKEGTAKIGDFGLALPMDRSRLTREGMMVGTVAYMPPEQAMGGEMTPMADLYSLGCMLYETIAGRPPFLGDDPVAVIGQHIHTPPVAPSWHNPGCPRDLEALILRLLAKDSAQRPESAGEVLTALEGIDLTAIAERGEEEVRSLDSLAGGVFVGRQREMGELKASLEAALSGRGRLAMLVGEPGIGKTRTALELATYAGLRKAQVLWGRCYESQGMPAYWPWVQAIRAYVQEREPKQLRSEMGSGAADIAEIVSDVRQCLPDLEKPPALENPEAARFRLFDSIATFLKTASKAQPLVLILDDLQWADKSSLLLLQFVAGEVAASRLLIVGTYRDVELSRKHPLAQALGDLTRQRAFQRVLLRGLTQGDVARFIELTAGVKPPTSLVKAVYTQTEGNPMFVNEVVRLLVQEGELQPERVKSRSSWTLRIPEGVREVIGRRLNRLSERCNQVLTIAAVIGREFSLGQLAAISPDQSEDRALGVLEEAMGARVIEESPQAVGSFQFTHALIQETLAEELSLTRRVRLHAEIAGALEALYGKDAPAHAAELAYHYGEAEAVLGSDKLVEYALIAGEKALESYAYEEAHELFRKALVAVEDQPMDASKAALYLGLGRAENAGMASVNEAAEHLQMAFDYYARAGDAPRAVTVATTPFSANTVCRLMRPTVERALEMVPGDSTEAAQLLSNLIRCLSTTGGAYERAKECSQRALDIARRQGDKRLELRAVFAAMEAAFYHMRDEDMRDALPRALSLLAEVDSPWDEAMVHVWAGGQAGGDGNVGAAASHLRAALDAAERMRDAKALLTALYNNALLEQQLGNWDAAKSYLERLGAVSPLGPLSPGSLMLLACELGNRDQAESHLQRSLAFIGPKMNWSTVAAYVALSARASGIARWWEVARESARRALVADPPPFAVLWSRLALALAAAEEGDRAAVRREREAMISTCGRIPASRRLGRLLGIVDHAAGDEELAVSCFEQSLAHCRKAGYRPELAWTCCDYADVLLDRKGPGDEARAIGLLDESLEISRDLGMVPLMERVLSRREILKA